MPTKLVYFSVALMLLGSQAFAQNAGQIRLNRCLVSLIDGRETEVPALEPGQLVALEVREGRDVEAGTVLGRIDDKQAQAQREQRVYEAEVAREQAENDVNVRFAKASLRVAEAEYEQALAANKKVPGSITPAELRRLALNVEKTRLQIEVAEMEQRVAKYKLGVEQARIKEIDGMIERREIRAPLSGRVVEVVKQRGEWCEPGAVVLKMVQMDLLRVEGFVNAANVSPDDISSRPVTVQVRLAGNVVEQFQGKVVFVDPRVQAGGEYRVYAEVVNRMNREQSHWLLRPGADVEMVIDVRRGLADARQPLPMQNAASGGALPAPRR